MTVDQETAVELPASKTVSQLDDDGVFFLYPTEADLDPMSKDAPAYLMPANAVDWPPPEPVEGQRARWTGAGFVYEALDKTKPVPALEAYRQETLMRIDADQTAFVAHAVGGREQEYALAESEARAFLESTETAVPGFVLSYALSAGLPAGEAAAHIVDRADAWKELLVELRTLRLRLKARVRNAGDVRDIGAAREEWEVRIHHLWGQWT